MNILHPPLTMEELEALRQRNQERIARFKQSLGRKHLLHEANKLQRQSNTMRTPM